MTTAIMEGLERRMLLVSSVRFAVIGDFGLDGAEEAAVAAVVKSFHPNLVITTGDNNYPLGAAATVDQNIGKHYQEFIYPYTGAYGSGSGDGVNHFFPSLGNHDWYTSGAQPYLDYFSLPGNERYYRFTAGPVEFFAIDSDPREPDLGYIDSQTSTAGSVQAQWLRDALAASTASWQIVYYHHPPYSSGTRHAGSQWMRWPFAEWGADAVLAGHEHNYERIVLDGLPYFVNGSGGAALYKLENPIEGSAFRHDADHGAMIVDANDAALTFRFVTETGTVMDTYTLKAPPPPPPWVQRDVGRTGLGGWSAYARRTFAVGGAGQDIFGWRDTFHFTYRALAGDGQIIARVGTIETGNKRTKVGLMIRRSLRPDSPYAGVMLTGAGTAVHQQRTSFAARTGFASRAQIEAPYWLKVERRGDIVSSYISRSGRRWALMGRTTLAMPRTVYVGLAISSGDPGALRLASFDRVTLYRLS